VLQKQDPPQKRTALKLVQAALLELLAAATGARVVPTDLCGTTLREFWDRVIIETSQTVQVEGAAKVMKARPGCGPAAP
jgi:hypothetical protein